MAYNDQIPTDWTAMFKKIDPSSLTNEDIVALVKRDRKRKNNNKLLLTYFAIAYAYGKHLEKKGELVFKKKNRFDLKL